MKVYRSPASRDSDAAWVEAAYYVHLISDSEAVSLYFDVSHAGGSSRFRIDIDPGSFLALRLRMDTVEQAIEAKQRARLLDLLQRIDRKLAE